MELKKSVPIKANQIVWDDKLGKNIYFDKEGNKYVEGVIPRTWSKIKPSKYETP